MACVRELKIPVACFMLTIQYDRCLSLAHSPPLIEMVALVYINSITPFYFHLCSQAAFFWVFFFLLFVDVFTISVGAVGSTSPKLFAVKFAFLLGVVGFP